MSNEKAPQLLSRCCLTLTRSGYNPHRRVLALLDEAMLAIEKENPSLKGVLPKDYARESLDKRRLGELSLRRHDCVVEPVVSQSFVALNARIA